MPRTNDHAPLRVACRLGVVGSEVFRLLGQEAADLRARAGAPLEVAGVAVRRPGRQRGAAAGSLLLTTDAMDLVTRPDVDIVIELIGGIEARSLLLAAMQAGKSVITANKELLAADSAAMHQVAREHGVDLYYEGAVAGAIPLLRPLRESLAGDAVRRVLGIVNGTTNYILDKMDTSGTGFAEALAEAQALGYAEADPTADVEGFDAAAKAAILAGLAFHTRVTAADVYREGIGAVTAADIDSARALGCVIKLLAICERCDGGISARVHPAMIPRVHPLAAVREAYNAVFVEAESAGRLMLRRRRGRPRRPARSSATWSRSRATAWPGSAAPIPPPTPSCPCCRWRRATGVRRAGRRRPARRAGPRRRGIRPAQRVDQGGAPGGPGGRRQPGHRYAYGAESELAATVAELGAMPAVRAVDSVLRVEGEEGE